jgi:hypothetical protein
MGSRAAKLIAVDLRHVRPVKPLRFPSSSSEWDMPQSGRHHRMCELMYQVLVAAVGPAHTVGGDQFVYYDASAPRRCVAPDAFVKLGVPAHHPDVWRAWLQGAPEVCVEILSPSDSAEKLTFAEKLRRYAALGTRELVVFNSDAKHGKRLRVWDRVRDDFIERVVLRESTPCTVLERVSYVVAKDAELGDVLRAEKDGELILTALEQRSRELALRDRELAARERELAARERELAELRRHVRQVAQTKRKTKK